MKKQRVSSWHFLNAAWQFLMQRPRLLVFPILSTIVNIIIFVAFAIGLGVLLHEKSQSDWTVFALFLLVFFVINVVSIFFGACMVAFVKQQIDTGDATISQALRFAISRWYVILKWSLLTSSVGAILNALEEKLGIFGRVTIWIIGVTWAIGSYFVVPILIYENCGPFDAVKKSASLLKNNSGKQLRVIVGTGFLEFCLLFGMLIIMMVFSGLLGQLFGFDSFTAVLCSIFVWFALLILWTLFSKILTMLIQHFLYRYITNQSLPEAFNAEKLESVITK